MAGSSYYGFVGRHVIARAPASEIEFVAPHSHFRYPKGGSIPGPFWRNPASSVMKWANRLWWRSRCETIAELPTRVRRSSSAPLPTASPRCGKG